MLSFSEKMLWNNNLNTYLFVELGQFESPFGSLCRDAISDVRLDNLREKYILDAQSLLWAYGPGAPTPSYCV